MKSQPVKLHDGRWRIRIYPYEGKKNCKQRTFKTKGECISWAQSEYNKIRGYETIDNRTLNELIEIWYSNYGINLRSGLDRKKMMLRFVEQIGNIPWKKFSKKIFIEWRSQQSMTPNSINHFHTYIKSLFTQLSAMEFIICSKNPMDGIKKLRVQESELSYLSRNQIQLLIDEADFELSLFIQIGLSAGLRWGEIQSLTTFSFKDNFILVQGKTKSLKNRQVAVSDELANMAKEYLSIHGRFKDKYSAFKLLIKRLNIRLPRGQLSHVLRHTFASYFVQNGGDILTLQKLLGHSDIKTTMRYAHLAPTYSQQALSLNPLSSLHS